MTTLEQLLAVCRNYADGWVAADGYIRTNAPADIDTLLDYRWASLSEVEQVRLALDYLAEAAESGDEAAVDVLADLADPGRQ